MKLSCAALVIGLFVSVSPLKVLAVPEIKEVELSQIEVADAQISAQSPGSLIFSPLKEDEIRRGYATSNLWLRFLVENKTDNEVQRVLTLSSPLVGKLTLWKQGGSEVIHSGPGYPSSQRSYPSRLGNFSLTLQPNEKAQYFLRSETHHAVNTQLKIQTPREEGMTESTSRAVFFFYFGGMAALVIYNLLLGLSTQEKAHVSYSLFAASFGMTVLVLHGVVDTYLLPQEGFVFSNYLMFFSSLTAISASLFVGQFLGISRRFKWIYWGLRGLGALAVVPLIASYWVPHHRELFFLGYWIDLTIASLIVFFVGCGLYIWIKKKNPLALFFLFSWLVVLVGAFVWMGSLHGLLPNTLLSQYSLLFANLGEMVILSLGLAYKIRILDSAKKRAERDAEEKNRYHRLVRVLSHDIGNTVSSIEYHSEMLRDIHEAGLGVTHVNRISQALEKLGKILNSVRKEEVLFSFQEHGTLETVDLKEACHEALTQFDWQIEQKLIQAEVQVTTGYLVRADRSALINQVLANLISNSIKFSASGGTILFSVRSESGFTILSLHDDGTGILAQDLPYLFKGTKLISHKGTGNEGGTGIGTSLVGEYMRLFGGDVKVESVHQSQGGRSGTTVHLYFAKA